MSFLKSKTNIDFMGSRKIAFAFSGLMILASIALLLVKGLNLGIDFSGGSIFQLEFKNATSIEQIRETLETQKLGQSVIQKYSDNGYIIRVRDIEDNARENLLQALRDKNGDFEILRLEKVGPVVGGELTRQAIIAVLLALVGILIYITLRFQFRFAVVSVLALVHDAIITLGVFSLLGREIDLTFVAAILTIVGYSLNDTIVVLDRVRENWGFMIKQGLSVMINGSINQTLSRTINTSLTTLLPVITLLFFGGPVIANFALAMTVGIVVGTYSSIFIASALLVEWDIKSPAKA